MFRLKTPIKLFRIQSIFTEQKRKIVNKFTLPSDKPTQTEKEDIFSRNKKIAENIAHAVQTSNGQMNFLISGDWGMGKTSILYSVENQLINHRVSIFWFSPWKYSSVEKITNTIARSFLVKMAENFGRKYEVKNLYLSKKIETQRNIFSQFIIWISLIINLVSFFFLLGVVIYILTLTNVFNYIPTYISNPIIGVVSEFSKLDPDKKITIILAIIGLLSIPKLGEFFSAKVRQSADLEKETSPEQLEETYKNILDRTIRWKWLQKLVSIWENTFEDTALFFLGKPLTSIFLYRFLLNPLKIRKLVIFVDDLDRCNSDEIAQFLTGMKTFLQDDRVYFILAADINQIEEKLKVNKKLSINSLDYLRKIIQLSWSVPYLDKDKIEKLFKQVLSTSGVKDNGLINVGRLTNLCLGIQNPRKIKYYIRRLLFIINYYNDVFKDKRLSDTDTTFLFKLVMLTDLDHELYKKCSGKTNLYQELEKVDPSDTNHALIASLTKEKEGLNLKNRILALKIISYSTRTPLVGIDISRAFELVESSEGEPVKSQEFLNLSSSDPNAAVQHLENVEWDFEELVPALLGNTIQGLEKLIKYQKDKETNPELPELDEIGQIINNLLSCGLVIQKYWAGNSFSSFINKNISKPYFDKFKELPPKIFYARIPESLLNVITDLSKKGESLATTLLTDYFSDDWFNDYANFNIALDKIGFNNAGIALYQKIIEELTRFIEVQTDDVIARLSSQINNYFVQEKILEEYKEYYVKPDHQDIQSKLFNLLLEKSNVLSHKIKTDFVNYISENKDIKGATKTVAGFQEEWRNKASKFFTSIAEDSDPTDTFNFFKTIWPNNVSVFSLVNQSFFKKVESIISKGDLANQTGYCDLLYTMKTNDKKLQKVVLTQFLLYTTFLENIRSHISNPQIKRRLTMSIKNLKEVKKNG